MSNSAKKVTLVEILDKLTADKILINKFNTINNLDIVYQTEVVEINGNNLYNQ